MRKLLLLIILNTMFLSGLKAQVQTVVCAFESDSVPVSKRDLIATRIKLQNKGNTTANLKLVSSIAGNLLTMPDTVTLQPGKTRIIPVKFLPSADVLGGANPAVTVSYKNINTGELLNARLLLNMDRSGLVRIAATDPIVYINTTTGKATLRFRCANMGYADAQIVIKLTVNPTGLQIINPIRTLKLEAASQQIVEIDANYIRSGGNGIIPEFNVVAEVSDASGSPLSTSVIQVTSLGSRRADVAATQHDLGNVSGISYTNMNRALDYYTLSTSGNIIPTTDKRFDYNLNLNYYNGLNTTDIYDTWVGYTGKNFGMRVGNVMDNLDFSLFGRGIKLSFNMDEHNSVDAYGVQNSYLLYSQANNQLPFASTAALNYRYKNQLTEGNVAAIFNNNPLTRVQTQLVNGRLAIATGEKQMLELRGGASYETVKATTDSKAGAAAGVNYTYFGERFDINFNNYFSTAYYSGLQRGSLSLNNRINYRFNKALSVFTRYALIENSPRYLTDTVLLYNGFYNNTATYEAGFNITAGRFNVSFHPYWFNQSLSQANNQLVPGLNLNGDLRSTSQRLGIDLTYTFKSGKMFTMLSDFGVTESNNTQLSNRRYRAYRIMANYSGSWWGFHSLLQNGPYYLSEEAIANQTGNKYYAYSFGPDVHFAAFKNKLNVNITDYFNYTAYRGSSNHSLNTQVQYRIDNGWALSGEVFYNAYSAYNNSYNLQTRLGIVKRFDRTGTPGTQKLKLSFYEDTNHNNQWDAGEKALEGLVVNIADETSTNNSGRLNTVTDKKGVVEYVNLKEGNYSVNLLKSNGWNLPGQASVNLSKSKKIMIPMVKSGWLTGKINVTKQAYLNTKPSLEGLKVVAKNDKNITFSTLTNEDGEFELPLPIDHYLISIEADPTQYAINNQGQQVNVGQTNKQLEFSLTDERRKVVVKQF
ncbi:hypothetical protein IM792_01465 [Mucilaginibacter sp. JRF]|uniref:SdrD B-like domain-containing protein n=1 Tax=Mucilaginibacter sp. JRF TaxID=2780088 RepID=UPI00187F9AA7|nr:hypothetical protein [Mucilaginibacter sp. JRF]